MPAAASTTTTTTILRRALLYGSSSPYPFRNSLPHHPPTNISPLPVPASSPKFLTSSRNIPSVDSVVYDLEDSVSTTEKPRARDAVAEILTRPRVPGIREQGVRINSVDSGMALSDLEVVLKAPHIDTVVVPKVDSASSLTFITDVLRHLLPLRHSTTTSSSPPIRILALIESARALHSLAEICSATPYLSGLILGGDDLATSLRLPSPLSPSHPTLLAARTQVLLAARAFAVPSAIDVVCTAYRTPPPSATSGVAHPVNEELAAECAEGRRIGFDGKQVVHPSQVGVAQEAFAPGSEEVRWAVEVVRGAEAAEREGKGATVVRGRMVDRPVVERARGVVERARACGVDVEGGELGGGATTG
ncbi:MAG: hypothetical protein M1833_002536 [Piccolia ochrophora]|nr:MAG: hypothetical protein M1833_002536 [Piccolia ochrophora]